MMNSGASKTWHRHPTIRQAGYSGQKLLTNMVQGKTIYPVDNTATTDQYGRLMSVAYIDYNSTHYETSIWLC
jgi:hypothetical protein